MKQIALFTDVSLNPKTKKGMGAFAIVPLNFLEIPVNQISRYQITEFIKFKEFSDTSSTRLEVETVLFAFEYIKNNYGFNAEIKLNLYTDSQCVAGLLKRKEKLESNSFLSTSSNRLHKNTDLYKQFYEFFELSPFMVTKVIGHMPSEEHDSIHRIFSFIDKEVRFRFKQHNIH